MPHELEKITARSRDNQVFDEKYHHLFKGTHHIHVASSLVNMQASRISYSQGYLQNYDARYLDNNVIVDIDTYGAVNVRF